MPGGRPRKPAKLRALEGGRGHSRPVTPDLPAPVEALEPPDHLGEEERAVWLRHSAWLRKLGVESAVDAGQFEAMVRFFCRAQQADRVLRLKMAENPLSGLTMASGANGEVQRPEVAISDRCWTHYERLASKFGLDPAARAKLGSGEAKPERAGDVPPELRDASGS
jgi:P27 family predicted phage terminase small subunit